MGDFTLDSFGNDSYLVYRVQGDEQIDNAEKGMLQANEIDGVIKPTFSQRNLEKFIRYPVTSMLTIKDYFSREVKRADVLMVFCSLIENILNADEYMLKEDHFILDPEKVFVNIKTRRTRLVYIPVRQFSNENGIRGMLLSLLISCRYNPGEDMSYVAKLINAINKDSSAELQQLLREINEISSSEARPVPSSSAARTPAPAPEPVPVPARKPEPEPVRQNIPVHREEEKEKVPEIILEMTEDNDRLQPGEEKKKMGFFERREQEKREKKEKKEKEKKEKERLEREKKEKKEQEKKEKKGGFFGWKSQKDKKSLENDIDIPGLDIPGENDSKIDPVPKQKPEEKPDQNHEITARIVKAWAVDPEQDLPARPAENDMRESRQQKAVGEDGGPIQEGHSVYLGTGAAGASKENSTVIMGGGVSIKNTVKMGGSASTNAPKFIMAQLTRKKDGKTMMIQKGSEPFIIGSSADFVDFYVGDNDAIGAAHAQIRKDGSTYYIRDNNSVNHTYVNGQMLNAGENKPLNSGDIIRLGDEEFEFK